MDLDVGCVKVGLDVCIGVIGSEVAFDNGITFVSSRKVTLEDDITYHGGEVVLDSEVDSYYRGVVNTSTVIFNMDYNEVVWNVVIGEVTLYVEDFDVGSCVCFFFVCVFCGRCCVPEGVSFL